MMSTPRSDARDRPPVLDVRSLTVRVRGDDRILVDSIDLGVGAGEILGLVGESGSGKSMTASAIARLLPPLVYLDEGSEVEISGEEVTRLSPAAFRRQVRPRVGFVFQNPSTSLNPAMRIGAQIAESAQVSGRQAARRLALEMMDRVQIPRAAQRYGDYPHQFSGGMKQRVAIAIALARQPSLLLADEPTSALDVTVQAQICDLIWDLARDEQLAVLFITHDFGVVANICDRVAVMKSGKLVETGRTEEILVRPAHPYTASLIGAATALSLSGQRT